MMKICIIYHSETGNTRYVARHIASVFDAHLIEVLDTAFYSRLTRFLIWCKMARGLARPMRRSKNGSKPVG
jgi:flavodoxin